MKYFPIFLDLKEADVLVAGGGETALQKIRLLKKTEANIFVVARVISEDIRKLALFSLIEITLIERGFQADDVKGKRLVYAAFDNDALDIPVIKAAKIAGVLANLVDGPEHCDFITPSIVDRAPIVVAIGTEGTAPVIAREIKTLLDRQLPANFGLLGDAAAKVRGTIAEKITDGRARLRLWEKLLNGAFRRKVLAGDERGAMEAFEAEIRIASEVVLDDRLPGNKLHDTAKEDTDQRGFVALVGAGPGDPDLLTLKALQHLQRADVLIVDRLVNPVILDYARRDAKRIDVGKQAGKPSLAQEEINQIIVREALTGARVVRLKGGDPSIFGRAQEEIAACQLMGIEVEVVPGISAAQAASASINLPLTSRGQHRSITLLTAATKDQMVASDVMAFIQAGRPFAIYMGVKLAGKIVETMKTANADMSTPVIIVENASLPNERAISCHLDELELAVKLKKIKGPAILFVGLCYEKTGLMAPATLEVFKANNIVPVNFKAS